MSEILDAAYYGDVEHLRTLLDDGVNVNNRRSEFGAKYVTEGAGTPHPGGHRPSRNWSLTKSRDQCRLRCDGASMDATLQAACAVPIGCPADWSGRGAVTHASGDPQVHPFIADCRSGRIGGCVNRRRRRFMLLPCVELFQTYAVS